jgi:essential nuclear protein 1
LDPKTSKRIFELARGQQDELQMLDDEEEDTRPSILTRPRDDDDNDSELEDVEDEEIEEIFVSYSCHFSRKNLIHKRFRK